MKEQEIEFSLNHWIKTQGNTVNQIYFNRKNVVDAPIFKIKGDMKKPDLIIERKHKNKTEYIVVEVKDASHDKKIIDSFKIYTSYYKNYVEGKTKYFINDIEIKIDHFVIASQNSVMGYLFNYECYFSNLDEPKKRDIVLKYKQLPPYEGNKTKLFVRTLWSVLRVKKYNLKPSLGVLMAKKGTDKPYLFVMRYKKYLTKKSQWRQDFLEL
jgi:hypothetical protein